MPRGSIELAFVRVSPAHRNTLILGGTYALLGIGLTLIFGIMRVVNFTHGELYTFGAYFVFLVVFAARPQFHPGAAGRNRGGFAARRHHRILSAASDARRRYRHDDAGNDRRDDRHAEWRAIDLGRRREVGDDALSGDAVRDRSGLGVLVARVRAGDGAGLDRRNLRSDQPDQTRQGDARDISGSRHGLAHGRQHPGDLHGDFRASARAWRRPQAHCLGLPM